MNSSAHDREQSYRNLYHSTTMMPSPAHNHGPQDLESMDLDKILLHNSCLHEEVRNILALVALELDDLS